MKASTMACVLRLVRLEVTQAQYGTPGPRLWNGRADSVLGQSI
jgi:hypothetical protein